MNDTTQRLRGAYGGLDRDQRFAAGAAVGLLLTMFLPWYEKNVVIAGTRSFASDTISAFGAVSFVEAAIFLVAAGVVVLLLARADSRAFHLPGGDGTVIFAAGLWATALIFYRVFDRPDVSGDGGTVGIQWGFFVAFVAAGALAFAGQRIRVAGRPEPHLPAADPEPERQSRSRRERPPRSPRERPPRASHAPVPGTDAGSAREPEPDTSATTAGEPGPTPTRRTKPAGAPKPGTGGADTAKPKAGPARAPDAAPADDAVTDVVPLSEAATQVAARQARRRDRAVTREDARQLTFEAPNDDPPPRRDESPRRRD
ncbi:MAG: hypothetical protein Q8O56_12260 [Solirubrobacteraceae bacterium]|nr:hypothetical protein [Solirubrobacteraceae bacterium]